MTYCVYMSAKPPEGISANLQFWCVLGDTDELVRFEVIDQGYEQVKRSFILEEYALMARC